MQAPSVEPISMSSLSTTPLLFLLAQLKTPKLLRNHKFARDGHGITNSAEKKKEREMTKENNAIDCVLSEAALETL